jgi:hypothetical protein
MGEFQDLDAAAHVGIDVAAIIENLRLTPEQRVLKHQAALDIVLEAERVAKLKSVG